MTLLPWACVLCLLTVLPAQADDAHVLTADHEVHEDLTVDTRWIIDHTIMSDTRIELAWPLARGTTLHSDDVRAALDTQGRISHLVTTRDLAGELTLSVRGDALTLSELPLASPTPPVVERVRFMRPLQVFPSHAGMGRAFGVRITRSIDREARRTADRLLDGAGAHRRLGALYLRSDEGPLLVRAHDGTPRSQRLRHVTWVLFAALLFGCFIAFKRAKRRMHRERREAYLSRILSAEDRKLLELDPYEES